MIKFKSMSGNRQIVGIGITDDVVRDLKKGKPVVMTMQDVEIDSNIEIFLFYGQDESSLYTVLKKAGIITPKTKVVGEIPIAFDPTVN